MAYTELFALTFVAPCITSGKEIPPETVQELTETFDAGSVDRAQSDRHYK